MSILYYKSTNMSNNTDNSNTHTDSMGADYLGTGKAGGGDMTHVVVDSAAGADNANADAAHSTEVHGVRRTAARAPRRRDMPLSGVDMAHISESLEESVAAYEHSAPAPRHTVDKDSSYNSNAAAYTADPGSAHYEAELANMEALRAARAKRAANGSRRQAVDVNGQQTAHVARESAAVSAKTYRTEQGSKSNAYAAEPIYRDENDNSPRKRKHPILRLMLLLFLLGAGFIGYKFITGQSGYYTVAVFGVDSRNGNVGKEALSDVNIIARIDRASGEIKLVSLYRDTYAQIDDSGTYHKLNEAYFRGGAKQAVWAVEHNTDVNIDDYATFNWKAVADAINILGGIDLEISDAEFKYINAFITETVNSTGIGSYQLEHAGMNHLDGVQSVAYARLRLMDTDFQRTARQRKVIALALDKAKAADYATLLNIMTTIMPQISTSVTPDDLVPFMHGVGKYYISETAGFPFDKATADVGRLDCVVPVTLESNAIKLHEFLYPDSLYTPSAGLKRISDKIINDTGLSG